MQTPIVLDGIELETICPICKGNPPKMFLFGHWCSNCRGLGVILTEKGKALCQLILNHVTGTESSFRLKQ
jgi:hypothetical protein